MTPIADFDCDLIRDHLTKGQKHWIKSQREIGIITLIALEANDGSFCGYYPQNAKMKEGMYITYKEDGSLDSCPIVVAG